MHGLIVVDKPAGMSSAKAIARFKQRGRKVGHAGTLDPFATGILLVLVGDATRLSNLAMALPKRYRATVRFGVATDTLDPEGAVTAEADPGAAAPPDLHGAVGRFLGTIEQVPPAYSALKVDGRRAYELARAGEAPAMEPRTVTVHAIDVAAVAWPEVEIDVACGQGTYIRSIARDLGAALDLPAHLSALRRTAIGPFDRASDDVLSPLLLTDAAGLPRKEVDRETGRAFAQGRPFPAGDTAVVVEGRLVGIARAGLPRTVFGDARRWLEED